MDEDSRVPSPRPVQDEEPLTTGEGPMTPRQASYLHSLCEEAGAAFDDSLTGAAAARRIEELKAPLPGRCRGVVAVAQAVSGGISPPESIP